MAENPTIAALRANSGGLNRASGPESLNFPWMNAQQGAINFTPRRFGGLNNPQRLTMPEAAPFEVPYFEAPPQPLPPPRDPFEFQFDEPLPESPELNVPEPEVPLTVPIDIPDYIIPEPVGEVTVEELPPEFDPQPVVVPPPPPPPAPMPEPEPETQITIEELLPPEFEPQVIVIDPPLPPPPPPAPEPEGDVTVYEEIEVPPLDIPESVPVTYVPLPPTYIPVEEPIYDVEVEEVIDQPAAPEPPAPTGGGAETVAGPSGGGYDNFLINLWLSQLYSPQGVVTVEEIPDEPTSRLAR